LKINKSYHQLFHSKRRYNALKGGAGSGKSYGVTQIEILKAIERPEKTLWLRKVHNTLRNSVFALIQSVLIDEGFRKGVDYFVNKTDMSFDFANGSKFILSGVDDVEKLKSVAGITRIVIEEATELSEEEFNQIDLRLRGIHLINPQITLMFNPVSINHWLCKRFDTQLNQATSLLINSTYRDNAFLDEQYKETLENLINIDINLYRIYVLGEWGLEDPSKLFARDYNREKQFGKKVTDLYHPQLPVFLTWDFNVQNTCLAIQAPGSINVLKEYHKIGYDLEMLSNLIKADFQNSIFIINGDASGSGGSAFTKGNISGYQILRSHFFLMDGNFRVPTINPSHLNSRLLTNLIFKFREVNISNECTELDRDLLSVEVDVNGSIDPYKKKHPERSHWLDPLRYHYNSEHRGLIKELGIPKAA
jgi:hypothetical protein